MENSKDLELELKKAKLEELQEKLDALFEKEREIYYSESDSLDKRIEIRQEIEQVYQEKNRVYEEIFLLENQPVASNEILDIYPYDGDIKKDYGNFAIFLHGTSTRIGHVRLNRVTDKVFGNIGYGLDEEYRGHHFMLQSLNLLKDSMLKMKIVKPIITVEPDNLASVKTIQAFGGILTEGHQEYNRYYDTYEVDLTDYESGKGRR